MNIEREVVFADLNPILHPQLRLAIISLLIPEEKADFARIKEVAKATPGNTSVQVQKLETADYISIKKTSKENYPDTETQLTPEGLSAFEEYIGALKNYINP